MINIDYDKLTPMMKQYVDIKNENKDAILMFRLGDFYEMFFDDAQIASKELDIVLTSRGKDENEIPMCGVPYHAAESYISRLINKGYKVAICEQLEDPSEANGIVKRGIVRIITPGTRLNLGENQTDNNFLGSLYVGDNSYSLVYIDYSTGDLYVSEEIYASTEDLHSKFLNQIFVLKISEIITNKDTKYLEDLLNQNNILINTRQYEIHDDFYLFLDSLNLIGISLDKFKSRTSLVQGLNMLYSYLDETQFGALDHIRQVRYVDLQDYMVLDSHTLYSLDIFSDNSISKKNSLYDLLNETRTAMGSRKLRSFLERPLKNKNSIQIRLDSVEKFLSDLNHLDKIRSLLYCIYDLERIMVRISGLSHSPKDMTQLKNSLENIPQIFEICNSLGISSVDGKKIYIDEKIIDIYKLIETSIVEDAKTSFKEGGLIKDGFSKELDDLKSTSIDSTSWLAKYEKSLRDTTGINNLKIKYNKILGYFIEVSKGNLDKVPDYFIRKQTLVNSERFFTEELKTTEIQIINSQDYINDLEEKIYLQIRTQILDSFDYIIGLADLISYVDVFSNFAHLAYKYNYCKPQILDKQAIEISNGRHPIVENNEDIFISNDSFIDDKKNFVLLTGPNMAGKSTYMRQIALICIMMQIGSYVPASSAKLGVFDRVFTRIGAHDRLYAGESTFMVEMKEMADIIDKATTRSLIILDEVGRGTSTYDGLSMARSLVEYIIEDISAICIFATHFHELIMLEDRYENIKNQTMAVEEKNGDIHFLRQVVDGGSDRSYGIHVAKLAGINNSIIEKAREYLNLYENKTSIDSDLSSPSLADNKFNEASTSQLDENLRSIIDNIKKIDINDLTPIEALLELEKIKEAIDQIEPY